MKKVLVFVFISIILVGCKTTVHYLTPEEAMKYPVVMIANTDINYGKKKIVKGTIFIVNEVGGYKYKIWTNNLYMDTGRMLAKSKTLPKDALFIKLQEDSYQGFIVYPTGEFVYDNYYEFTFNKGKFHTFVDQECTYNKIPPFILKKNR